MHFPVDAVGALVEHHGEDLAAFVGGFVHLPHSLGVHACRLFAHHVEPGGKSLFRQDRVLVVGHGDEHGVAQAALNQLAALFKNLYGFRDSVLCPKAAGFLLVGHSGQGDFRAFARQNVLHMGGAHIAHANDAKFYLFQKKDSFLFLRSRVS